MTTFYSDLFAKLELAWAGLAAIKAPTLPVLPGQGNPIVELPYTVVFAQNTGEEDPPDTGCFWADVQMEIHTSAATDVDGVNPAAARNLQVATLFDVYMTDTLRDDLNSVGIPDFTAIGVRTRNTGFAISGDEQINILKMEILCCPSTRYP